MIEKYELIKLLNKYGINGQKLANKNPKILNYGEYIEIEKVVKFLLNKGFTIDSIEKCPSIIAWTSASQIENTFNWFINQTKITVKDLKKCLHVLGGNLDEMKRIYEYVTKKYGIEVLKNCLTILQGEYHNIVSITISLENTIGLDIVKNNGGSILYHTTSDRLQKILTIPFFRYNEETKTYNQNLLTPTTFERSYTEIVNILKLDYWNQDKFKLLLAPSLWNKTETQIKEILELKYIDTDGKETSYWSNPKFLPLLTPTIWKKDASEIRNILELPYWSQDKFKDLLTSSIWNKTETQIKEILELPYWNEGKFISLLTPTIWKKDASQVKAILNLPYWDEEKFKPLLTPTIWLIEANEISNILSLSYWNEERFKQLLTPTIWKQNAIQIKEILGLPYWNEERFKSLLTPGIWKKDTKEIIKILSLPYWNEEKYNSLLVSSIWDKTALQIEQKINFCISDPDLKDYANNPTLIYKITFNELVTKTNYLRHINTPIAINGRPNSIYGMSNINMQKKYGISKKELIRDYLNVNKNKTRKK